jgi:cupin 2 domain-containing protein
MKPDNLFSKIPTDSVEEWNQAIVMGSQVTVERIVSQGNCSAEGFWYDQEWDEWVAVLQGAAGLEFEGKEEITRMDKGDHLLIPAHVRHRVAWTSTDQPTIWLAVHFRNRPTP